MMPTKIEYPQVWLHQLMRMLEPWFTQHGHELPQKVRLSYTNERSHKVAGRAHLTRSEDGWQNVFIHARLSDDVEIGQTLIHELVHCALPKATGHGPLFRKMATDLGLVGKMRIPEAGPELATHLRKLIAALGPNPHRAMPWFTPSPKGPKEHGYVARCSGCHSVVRMKSKTYERGVRIICNNEDCENYNVDMEIEEEIPQPKKPRAKPTKIA